MYKRTKLFHCLPTRSSLFIKGSSVGCLWIWWTAITSIEMRLLCWIPLLLLIRFFFVESLEFSTLSQLLRLLKKLVCYSANLSPLFFLRSVLVTLSLLFFHVYFFLLSLKFFYWGIIDITLYTLESNSTKKWWDFYIVVLDLQINLRKNW